MGLQKNWWRKVPFWNSLKFRPGFPSFWAYLRFIQLVWLIASSVSNFRSSYSAGNFFFVKKAVYVGSAKSVSLNGLISERLQRLDGRLKQAAIRRLFISKRNADSQKRRSSNLSDLTIQRLARTCIGGSRLRFTESLRLKRFSSGVHNEPKQNLMELSRTGKCNIRLACVVINSRVNAK